MKIFLIIALMSQIFSCRGMNEPRLERNAKKKNSANSGLKVSQWKASNYFEKDKCTHLSDEPFVLSSAYVANNHVLLNMLQRISELPNKEEIDAALSKFGAKSSFPISESNYGGYRALFVEMGPLNILVFRGTNNIIEGLLDAKYFQTSLSKYALPGKAHSGFVDHYDVMREEVLDRVRKADSSVPLIITGHSLGGAVSYLAALDFDKQNIPFASVYTAGAPRLGDIENYSYSKSILKGRFFRLEHVEDVVPHAPPIIESKNTLAELGAGGILGSAIDAGIESANFHVSAGELIAFDDGGIKNLSSEVGGDISFWEKVGRNGLISFPVLTGLQVVYHMPRNYICAYSKIILTSK